LKEAKRQKYLRPAIILFIGYSFPLVFDAWLSILSSCNRGMKGSWLRCVHVNFVQDKRHAATCTTNGINNRDLNVDFLWVLKGWSNPLGNRISWVSYGFSNKIRN
jgi:hypothetical protein